MAVTEVPSSRISRPAVTPVTETVLPPDWPVWSRASVAAVTRPATLIAPESDLTSTLEPTRSSAPLRTVLSALNSNSPAWPVGAALSVPRDVKAPLEVTSP